MKLNLLQNPINSVVSEQLFETYFKLFNTKVDEWITNDANTEIELFLLDNKKSVLAGPFFRKYHKNGRLQSEEWRVDFKKHRLNAPAKQEWDKNGINISQEYYYQGSKDLYLKYQRAQKFRLL